MCPYALKNARVPTINLYEILKKYRYIFMRKPSLTGKIFLIMCVLQYSKFRSIHFTSMGTSVYE